MISPDTLHLINEYLERAQSILVLCGPHPSVDQAAAATALFLFLENKGKSVTLLSPEKWGDQKSLVVGSDRVEQKLGNKDLQISFDFQPDMVEKVSYNVDEVGHKIHLLIQPKRGKTPPDPSTMQCELIGTDADLIFLIAVDHLENDLGELYIRNEAIFDQTPQIAFHQHELEYGTIKIDTTETGTFCESIYAVLLSIGGEFTADIATDLLLGIEQATDSFRSLSTKAETFEVASKLLLSGARRFSRAETKQTNSAEKKSFIDAFSRVSADSKASVVIPQKTPKKRARAADVSLV